MAKRAFPKMEGGCSCGLVRYRLLDSPLFCYACHCSDCQHESGSAFSAAAIMEWDRIASIGKQPPVTSAMKTHKHTRNIASCPNCRNVLWSSTGAAVSHTLNVHVGCIDHPAVMAPDVHIYIEDKIDWVVIPEGTKAIKGDYKQTELWPRNSLIRLKSCMERWEQHRQQVLAKRVDAQKSALRSAKLAQTRADVETDADERTPTNGSPEPTNAEPSEELGDDDFEEFEKRAAEVERALQERLEKLTLKLEQAEDSKETSAPGQSAQDKQDA